MREYQDKTWRLNPVSATSLGIHDFDADLPDLTPDGIQHSRHVLSDLLQRLEAVEAASLSDLQRLERTVVEANLKRAPVDHRDRALDRVADDAVDPGDALDAARVRQRGDRANHLAGGEFDDRHARLGVGGHERDGIPAAQRLRRETQGQRQRHSAGKELAAVHGSDTTCGAPEVRPPQWKM